MKSSNKMKLAIQEVVRLMMDGVMNQALYDDPFIPDLHRAAEPLYTALVPDEIFKLSHFERRFLTQFGGAWEELAVVVAQANSGNGILNYPISGTVKSERLQRITEMLNRLEYPVEEKLDNQPDWERELKYILAGAGEKIPVTITCDLFVQNDQNGERYAFELKSALPNSDITRLSKEKILILHSMEPLLVDGAYFALPYNPYGERQNYDWSCPSRWFNMKTDPVVLIGDEFWEKIGGLGTYQSFIDAVNEIGAGYKKRIYRELLGIESPAYIDQGRL